MYGLSAQSANQIESNRTNLFWRGKMSFFDLVGFRWLLPVVRKCIHMQSFIVDFFLLYSMLSFSNSFRRFLVVVVVVAVQFHIILCCLFIYRPRFWILYIIISNDSFFSARRAYVDVESQTHTHTRMQQTGRYRGENEIKPKCEWNEGNNNNNNSNNEAHKNSLHYSTHNN